MDDGVRAGPPYLEDDQSFNLRKTNSYRFFIYTYMFPPIWFYGLYMVLAYPGVVGWTGDLLYDLVILALMFLIVVMFMIIGPKRIQISKIEVHADYLTPPFKPFKPWIMRRPYRQESARINPFDVGDGPDTEHCIEVVTANGPRWFFILKADRITGFLGASPDDNTVIACQMETKNRKRMMQRFGLQGHWFL